MDIHRYIFEFYIAFTSSATVSISSFSPSMVTSSSYPDSLVSGDVLHVYVGECCALLRGNAYGILIQSSVN